MKIFNELWFWFGLLICPPAILISVFWFGRTIGPWALGNDVPLDTFGLLFLFAVVTCCMFQFVRSFKLAKRRFANND